MKIYSKNILVAILIMCNVAYNKPYENQRFAAVFIERIKNEECNKIIFLAYLSSVIIGAVCLKDKSKKHLFTKIISVQAPLFLLLSRCAKKKDNLKKKYSFFNCLTPLALGTANYFLINSILFHPYRSQYIEDNNIWLGADALSISPIIMYTLGVCCEEYYYLKKFLSGD